MRMIVIVVSCASCIAPLLAVAPELPGEADRAKLVREIEDLVYTVPPEFGADALLRLVEYRLIHGRGAKVSLLKDAFQMAANAAFKEKLRRSWVGVTTDARDGWLDKAYDVGLDTESLRCRAIELMIPLNVSLAKNWLHELMPRPIPSHNCRSQLIYDPRRCYHTLGLI